MSAYFRVIEEDNTCRLCIYGDGYKTTDCITCDDKIYSSKGIVLDLNTLDIERR